MESRISPFFTAAIVALLLMKSSSAEQQQAAAPLVEFHIPSQPLAYALNAWAQQSGLQLIWPANGEVAHMQSRSLYGRFEPMKALTFLLQDSGLQYSVLKEGTVTVGERDADSSTVVSVKDTNE